MVRINNYLPDDGDKKIEETIIQGLTSQPKMISSAFFYDDTGSKLFEQITDLDEYYLTRTELPLIKKAAKNLQSTLQHIDIVELGSGNCVKISLLFDKVSEEFRKTIRYIPFDVSISAIKQSSNTLLEKYPGIRIYAIAADFLTQLHLIPKKSKKIICFLGSTIGNLKKEKAKEFLVALSRIMNSGDILLIGFDMVKDKEILEKAYNDTLNITRQFNKNILNVINNLIGTDFDEDNFEHVAFFNKEKSRIEMHLKAVENVKINCPGYSSDIIIHKGETIHTENSYKFTNKDIRDFAQTAQVDIQNRYTDENKWFSLVEFIKK
ncbi:MAG: L-histidine N(alpha)-methyltransferase [Thermoplasmatota archaeon]